MNKKVRAMNIEADFLCPLSPRENLKGLTAQPSHGQVTIVATSFIEEGLMCQKDARLSNQSCGAFILECLRERVTSKQKPTTLMVWVWIAILTILVIIFLSYSNGSAWGEECTTQCSYYTKASCLREGTSGITASGEKLKDEGEYTFASRTLPFGTRLLITNKLNGRKIVARCNDRGPNLKLWKKGRTIDLNLSSAKALGIVQSGVAMVTVERVKETR